MPTVFKHYFRHHHGILVKPQSGIAIFKHILLHLGTYSNNNTIDADFQVVQSLWPYLRGKSFVHVPNDHGGLIALPL